MGIGGLDHEFNDIFRRAFASRVFPPALVEKLGIQHVKGLSPILSASDDLTAVLHRNPTTRSSWNG